MRISVVAWPCVAVYAMIISLMLKHTNDALSADTQKLIDQANKSGPYLGLVILNSFELDPLLQSPNFTSTNLIIDFSGKHTETHYEFDFHCFKIIPFTLFIVCFSFSGFNSRKEISVWNHY
ncbi:hypothetical protein RchiOBHm_Chr6g0306031 [Rosa chinensis]|uniref:Uncharacterized protein n=1 Tax=Rosa chinensis TaxID=74649 RepID=A0A2P6Q000_ROSCH|nr:hypothetical protein RchiOBHm_Chr6g0306031 [Rosa chinensis]